MSKEIERLENEKSQKINEITHDRPYENLNGEIKEEVDSIIRFYDKKIKAEIENPSPEESTIAPEEVESKHEHSNEFSLAIKSIIQSYFGPVTDDKIRFCPAIPDNKLSETLRFLGNDIPENEEILMIIHKRLILTGEALYWRRGGLFEKPHRIDFSEITPPIRFAGTLRLSNTNIHLGVPFNSALLIAEMIQRIFLLHHPATIVTRSTEIEVGFTHLVSKKKVTQDHFPFSGSTENTTTEYVPFTTQLSTESHLPQINYITKSIFCPICEKPFIILIVQAPVCTLSKDQCPDELTKSLFPQKLFSRTESDSVLFKVEPQYLEILQNEDIKNMILCIYTSGRHNLEDLYYDSSGTFMYSANDIAMKKYRISENTRIHLTPEDKDFMFHTCLKDFWEATTPYELVVTEKKKALGFFSFDSITNTTYDEVKK
jgi:hypothetical protein